MIISRILLYDYLRNITVWLSPYYYCMIISRILLYAYLQNIGMSSSTLWSYKEGKRRKGKLFRFRVSGGRTERIQPVVTDVFRSSDGHHLKKSFFIRNIFDLWNNSPLRVISKILLWFQYFLHGLCLGIKISQR